MLLYIQNAALSVAGILLYLIAKERIPNKSTVPILFVMIYFLYPYLSNIVFNPLGYNELCFSIPALLALLYSLKRDYRLYLFMLFLCLSIKEELLDLRRKVLGVVSLLISIIWGISCIYVIVPYFRGEAYPFFWIRYSSLGEDLLDCIKRIISYPELITDKLFIKSKLIAVVLLFLPLSFLPILDIRSLYIIFPYLVLQLLSDWKPQYHLLVQYSAPIIPIIFRGAIEVYAKLRNRYLIYLLIGMSVVSAISFYSPPFITIWNNAEDYSFRKHLKSLLLSPQLNAAEEFFKVASGKIKRIIPPSASISCQNNLCVYFADREKIYEFPYRLGEYVLLYPANVGEVLPPPKNLYITKLRRLKESKNYKVILNKFNFLLFKQLN